MAITQEKTGLRELKVKEVMHEGCITVKSDATLTAAVKKMKEAGVSSLVVEPRYPGDAYGIVSRADVLEKAVKAGPRRFNFSSHKVFEIMTKPVVTVSPGLKVKYAVRLMDREKVRHLPVFDGSKVVGMVSHSDVFQRLLGPSLKGRIL